MQALHPRLLAWPERAKLTINTNFVSTFLPAYLLLPRLEKTAQRCSTHRVTNGSATHLFNDLLERTAPEGETFNTLNEREEANATDRDSVSELPRSIHLV